MSSGALRNFKSYTSKDHIKQIEKVQESRSYWMLSVFAKAARNSNYQFWTYQNHAEQIESNNFLETKIE